MRHFKLQIITPKQVVYEKEVSSVTAPAADGEITILFMHAPLFSLLTEGIVLIKDEDDESFFSIGGGYLETDGKAVRLLVSRAYGQDEIDEEEVKKAMAQAERDIKEAPDEVQRQRAMGTLRRSIVDMKLARKVRGRKRSRAPN